MRIQFIFIVFLLFFFPAAASCQSVRPEPPQPMGGPTNDQILQKLTSPDEAVRFEVIDTAKPICASMEAAELEAALSDLREKNVGTLIYLLIKTQNNVVYNIDIPAKMNIENAIGSFPNIAYYYARVLPEKGLAALRRLYLRRPEHRLVLCKSIGETRLPEAMDFLMEKLRENIQSKQSIYHQLAGLSTYGKILGKDELAEFFKIDLDREELILLSDLKTDLSFAELIRLYDADIPIQQAYVIEYVFHDPLHYFDVFQYIIDKELQRGHGGFVLELMMSDGIRTHADPKIQSYRKSVMEKLDQENSN